VGSTTVHEPAWSEDDLEYALAWADIRADTHPPCGHRLSVSADPRNFDAHEVVEVLHCDVCQAREDYAEQQRSDGGKTSAADVYVVRLDESRRREVRFGGQGRIG